MISVQSGGWYVGGVTQLYPVRQYGITLSSLNPHNHTSRHCYQSWGSQHQQQQQLKIRVVCQGSWKRFVFGGLRGRGREVSVMKYKHISSVSSQCSKVMNNININDVTAPKYPVFLSLERRYYCTIKYYIIIIIIVVLKTIICDQYIYSGNIKAPGQVNHERKPLQAGFTFI